MSIIEDFFRTITETVDQGINLDEFVVFYPSIGTLAREGGNCRIEVRGRIYEERQTLSELPTIALALAGAPNAKTLAASIGNLAEDADSLRIFKHRVRDFVLDGERDEQFDIEITGTPHRSHRSNRFGFFGLGEPWYTVSAPSLSGETHGDSSWIEYTARGENNRAFHGRSRLLGPRGVIVVSDIDDTIKDSNVPEPAKLIVNTLLRPFRSTPGMAAIYKAWEKRNARFIYLTNSPYQLFSPLNEYLHGEGGYPDGFYYMRYVDVDLKHLKQDIASLIAVDDKIRLQENPKKHNLIPILEAFPERDFVLVGDSTEFDADIYVDLYRGENFPAKFSAPRDGYSDRIRKIYIRDVKNSQRRHQAEEALARLGDKSVAMFFDDQNPGIQEDAASIFKNA